MGVRSRIRSLLGRPKRDGGHAEGTMSDGFPAPRAAVEPTPRAPTPAPAPVVPKAEVEPARTVSPEAAAASDLKRPSAKVQEADDKQARFMARARKGMLKFLEEQGGSSALGAMHDHSEKRYLLAHQGFSRLMESMVDANYVNYDERSGVATLTDEGRAYMAS